MRKFLKEEISGLTSQLKRSASSVGDCLAEGSAKIRAKDKAHLITMSYSSAIETVNHKIGALEFGYITKKDYIHFRLKVDELTYKLNAMHSTIRF